MAFAEKLGLKVNKWSSEDDLDAGLWRAMLEVEAESDGVNVPLDTFLKT